MKNDKLKEIGEYLLKDIDFAVTRFAEMMIEHQPRWYAGLGLEECKRIASYGVSMSLECFIRGDLEPMGNYFNSCAEIKLDRGVGIRDVVEGTLLGKQAFIAVGMKFYTEQADLLEFLAELEDYYVQVLTLTADRYSGMLLSRLNAEHVRNKLLLEASRTVTSALDPDEVLSRLAEVLAGTVGEGCCTIFLVNPETGGLAPCAGFGYGSKECQSALQGLRLCPSGSTLSSVDGKSYGFCSSNKASSTFADILPEAVRSGSASLFHITNSDRMVGVALVSSEKPGFTFDAATTELIGGILNTVAVAIESAAAARQTKRQLMESESLRRVANVLLQSPEGKNGSVLSLIADEARTIVNGMGSVLMLLEGDSLHCVCGSGAPRCPMEFYPVESTYYGSAFQTGETIIVRDAQSEIPEAERSEELRTLIVVPLLEGDKKLGLLMVSNKSGGFDHADKRIMEMFAAQAVLALRNSRMFEQSEKLVVQGERQRLARELHDSVTQALYAITFCSDAAVRSFESGKSGAAIEQLKALQGMAQQGMRDMRSLIFDLHPPELESEGLVGAIQARLNSVEIRSGLGADLFVEGDERRLPLRVEEELFRIAIEALNNSTKHSKAESVTVKVDFAEGKTVVQIIDDGQGFDIATLPTGGMGLRGIRERVERINAHLDINSESGKGTVLTVKVFDVEGTGGGDE
ncbi:GAF domain-containing sensor histidine kinase [Maridesulfovibrio salexigens]|uniref:GAF sensor signal transduction histidine kinase n=1 Tax=Maridesulfovibrio salexigens (strain ATCC 14822 / DSM 2638 / NCIMB 8403 / VKM B-1763) TaxID=526222 RepID=C6BTX2_MARSD|nr:GAF domain-containing sensor histidine kinase [Maridesulfovibrio salexigens]ACS79902.1 GAF sensor signal transduction histidine kinase [Maridesulfovibrio salexigens DSM 2638]